MSPQGEILYSCCHHLLPSSLHMSSTVQASSKLPPGPGAPPSGWPPAQGLQAQYGVLGNTQGDAREQRCGKVLTQVLGMFLGNFPGVQIQDFALAKDLFNRWVAHRETLNSAKKMLPKYCLNWFEESLVWTMSSVRLGFCFFVKNFFIEVIQQEMLLRVIL